MISSVYLIHRHSYYIFICIKLYNHNLHIIMMADDTFYMQRYADTQSQ